MGTGYTRNDTANNIADGNIINASDFDGEFDAIVTAFSTSGHTHDGTSAEGGAITKLGPAQQLTIAATNITPSTDDAFDIGSSGSEFKDLYLDGVAYLDAISLNGTTITTTGAELNLMDGDSTVGTTAIADGDGLIINDAGTMRQTTVQTLAAYLDDEITAMPNLVTTGALDSGSITSGFGNIDNGASNITSGGLVKIDVDADADDLTGDSATGRLTIGAGEDLNLYHGGTNSYIVNDTGDLIIDTAGDVVLDANGADVLLKDDGTQYGALTNSSGNLIIKSGTTTALTFSGADVTIAGDLTISGDDLTMGTNTASMLLIADGTNFNPTAVGDLSEISTVANDDVFLAIDTSGGGLKKITRSTLVSGLAVSGASIANIVEDTTPQLGGSLDVNGEDIVSVSDGNITLTPNGTGVVRIDGSNGIDMQSGGISIKNSGAQSYVRFYCEVSNAHYAQLQAPAHSAFGGNVTLTLPATTSNLVGDTATQTLTNKTLTSPVLNTGVSGTAVADEDDMSSNSATKLATQQSIKAYVDSQSANMQFVLEDGDGTEVQITKDSEVKFVEGGGIDIDWTDTSDGSDGDPYDLTFTINAAQTGITSLLATDIKIGEDDETKIDFETADTINFYAGNEKQLILTDGALTPGTNAIIDLGTDALEFKDAFFDGTVEADAITIGGTNVTSLFSPIAGGTGIVTTGALDAGSITSGFGNIDTGSSTITTTGLISGGSLDIDDVLINGTTIGHTDDTDLMTLANGVLTVAGEVSMTTLDIGGTNVSATAAELNYVAGVTSAIQTQLDAKASTGKAIAMAMVFG
tara:strand:- start:6378 stop:8801 length:2424 start_codon:yes stop_codon:yes gene_type:complete